MMMERLAVHLGRFFVGGLFLLVVLVITMVIGMAAIGLWSELGKLPSDEFRSYVTLSVVGIMTAYIFGYILTEKD